MVLAPALSESVLLSQCVGPDSESFPVLWLLPPGQRTTVAAYYRFARLADHIADHGDLESGDKIALLHKMRNTLRAPHGSQGNSPCETITSALRNRMQERGIPLSAADDLLSAFLIDAASPACLRTWDDLMESCRLSAMPVGRFLLALNRETNPETEKSSDALCTALQILNHLQGLKEDWHSLNRCYLPLDGLEQAGGSLDDLAASDTSPALHAVIGQTCDHCASLLQRAAALPTLIRSRLLAAQSAATLSMAHALLRQIRQHDLLHSAPKPSRLDWVRAGGASLWRLIQW